MMRVKQAFVFEGSNRERSPKPVPYLAAVLAFSLWWTGCSTLSQTPASSSLTSSAQQISVVTNLPGAGMGSSYLAVLAVTGGQAPYRFVVGRGELPPGLVLNAETGRISGTPTRAGEFTFTILVSGVRSSGSRTYTVTVGACANCVTVQISPANPVVAPGGKLQFAAAVGNTSNTAVVWSASAGSISATGLFTAPGSGAESITVTATSTAEAAVHSSTVVTITSVPTLTITTARIPSAAQGAAYSESLTATGGQPPYVWSVLSGSLPTGLQLTASTGTLSGSPTQAGTFTFTVRSTDAASHTAQKALSLAVSSSGVACGPPAYGCSRTDQEIVQLPKTPPSVGNLLGANTIITDPDFGNRIVRVTDAHTNPDPNFVNRTYVSAGSGSADDNLWNVNSTLFIVEDIGANAYPFSFNPSTLQASRMYVSSFPTTNGLQLPTSGVWSRVNPNVLYTYTKTGISKYDFTDRTNPPAPQAVYDFTSSRNCLPAGFTATWKTMGGVSGDDTAFGVAFSNAGNQGSGVYAVVYKVGSGCSVLNTQTGQVGGDWGAKGTINIADRWTIHNVKLSKDGNWMVIARTACTSTRCSDAPYFWHVGTTTVSSCGDGGHCSGHWTEGYTHWVNCNNSPMANQVIRSFSEATFATNLTTRFPAAIVAPLDQHQSWNNVDPADSLPLFSTTWSTISPYPAPWYNEIIAVAADGSGTTWRFAHNFVTARSQRFSTAYAIGTISQDGRFFIVSSDWMGKLGSESGTPSCTIGSDCRGDVFIVELK